MGVLWAKLPGLAKAEPTGIHLMIFRILVLGIVISLAVMLFRKLQASNQGNTQTGSKAPVMRKCAQCGVHMPEPDAIFSDDHYFCSEQHRLTYQQEHQPHD